MVQSSDRQTKLITKLLVLSSAVTTKTLSEQLNVSLRTVKNDLKIIQAWLKQYGDFYRAKPRIGVWIEADKTQRAFLRRALVNKDTDIASTPTERLQQMVLLLTVSDNFITTQQIENKLDISKNTVITDLDKVESFLKSFQLRLERKNYYGYRIQGSELNIRSALEAVLNQMVSYYETPALISKNTLNDVRQLNFATVPEIQTVLNTVIDQLELNNYQGYTDFDLNDVLTMVVRLAISTMRLSMNHPINSYKPLKQTKRDVTMLPYQLFVGVMHHYDFSKLQDEYTYLLRGVNPRFDDQNIAILTKSIIEDVSHQTDYTFNSDGQLQVNLFSHLLTKLSNKYKFTNEYNPFVEDLQQRHPKLFKAVFQALRDNISANPVVVSESFVAFVTLHFLVSLEGKRSTKHARIIYVCSTGLGVTSLIKKEIERHMTNVEIAGFASIMNVEDKIKTLKPDLLVSIFPITTNQLPVIQVNPLPSESDLKRIRTAVAKVLNVQAASLQQTRVAHHDTNHDVEDQMRMLMLNGSTVYCQLRAYLGQRIPKKYQDAFMIHVMMAVQRIYFHHSYDSQMLSIANQQVSLVDVKAIKKIFLNNQLEINSAEINAILQYTHIVEDDRGDDKNG